MIVLLHKGNDIPRDQLGNWRPITLTNADYKILAKVLAMRMSGILQKLINEDPVGYLKGRNISTVIRTIDDVVNYLNKTEKKGAIYWLWVILKLSIPSLNHFSCTLFILLGLEKSFRGGFGFL